MLDTNIFSYLVKNNNQALIDKFESASKKANIVISTISIAEIFYGIHKKQSKRLELSVNHALLPFEKMPFDEKSAMIYGEIRADLSKKGQIIGNNDMLIAAHAKSLNATIITNNTKEFDRVEGLKVENWVA
ncbi:VapC toxin protein [uncultured Candidatus Thioglobus sp.]|nr:VapC toxin protein [uncultured Candidatus Thioglobus sp.]